MEHPHPDPQIDPATLLAAAEVELAAIDETLRRLDEGTYGRCKQCGSDLGDDRLAADPLAVLCASCHGA